MTLTNEFAAEDKQYLYVVRAPVSSLAEELNPRLHLMITDRVPDAIEREPERVFTRYNANQSERGGWSKESGGRNRMELRDELLLKRKRYADLQNEVLSKYGHTARVDHRKLSEQRIQRVPERHLGQA